RWCLRANSTVALACAGGVRYLEGPMAISGPPPRPPHSGPPPSGPPTSAPPTATPPPAAPPPANVPPNRSLWRSPAVVLPLALVLVTGGVVGAVVATNGGGGGGGGKTASGPSETFLAPAASAGANPFSPPAPGTNPSADAVRLLAAANLRPPRAALAAAARTTRTTRTPGATTSSTAPTSSSGATALTGNTVGLYGGTMHLSTCDPSQMTSYLQANPDKAQAWAGVEGIQVGDIPSYISRLTSVVLRVDTAVTNHGFIGGRATTIPEVLQAGTAVLVDVYG